MNNITTPKLVFLDSGSILSEHLSFTALHQSFPNCEIYEHSTDEQVTKRINDAHFVIANKARLHADAIAQARNLQLISVLATGYNNVDMDASRKHNVTVTNVRSYGTASVAQHVFMLMLNLATRFVEYHDAIQNGRWQTSEQFCLLDFHVIELAGKTLGIIGYGELGQAIERMASCFGMKTMIAEHKNALELRPNRHAFHTVLKQADVITLHCPLNSETQNLIDMDELRTMKPSAFLINTARGGIVNELALKEALMNGLIAGAAMDVLSEEPPVNGNVLLDKMIPNLIITPHTAWSSLDAQQRLLDGAVANCAAFLEGKAVNIVS